MKELWVEIDGSLSEELKKSLLKKAKQVCDVILADREDAANADETGDKIATSSDGSSVNVLLTPDPAKVKKLKKMGQTVAVRVTIRGKEDEDTAVRAAGLSSDYIILNCPDWKIIPLENLIAKTHGKSRMLAEVSSAREAKLALETLEIGADGVVLKASSLEELKETAHIVKKEALKLDLVAARIVELKEIGTGARVCIDTCELMKRGEGVLAGCQASGLFLVEAEVNESPYVETRPFRVNAGPVSLYTISSPMKTKYLSELKAGDEVLVVDREGNTRSTNIARVKIEWRPMILLEAEYNGRTIKTIVQNAETVRLVTPGDSKSVMELEKGDNVLAHVPQQGGRHFGTLVIEETVIER